MNDLKEVIYLLYTAVSSLKSLKIIATVKLNEQLIKRACANRQKGSIFSVGYGESPTLIRKEILWKPPYFFKSYEGSMPESEDCFHYEIVNKEYTIHFSQNMKKATKYPLDLYAKQYNFETFNSENSRIEPTYANLMANRLHFINPIDFVFSSDIEIVGKTTYLDRDVYQIRAYPMHEAFVMGLSRYFYHSIADCIDILLDTERGTLLRYETIIAGEAVETFEVQEIAFDLEIPDEQFADI